MGSPAISRRRANSPTGWTGRRGGASPATCGAGLPARRDVGFRRPAQAPGATCLGVITLLPIIAVIATGGAPGRGALESNASAGLPGLARERVWPPAVGSHAQRNFDEQGRDALLGRRVSRSGSRGAGARLAWKRGKLAACPTHLGL